MIDTAISLSTRGHFRILKSGYFNFLLTVDFLDAFLDEEIKKAMHHALIEDGQLQDKSFKAVAFRVLKGVAKKAAGEAGDELADVFGEAIRGLMTGDTEGVKGAIDVIDLNDETLTYA